MAELQSLASAQSIALEGLDRQHVALNKKVSMMRPGTLSTDMVEEQARYILGYNADQDIVVFDNNIAQ